MKALAKPSLSAWTVNQLARREPMQVRALMTAGERLREAQAELLGGGDPVELQAALRRQRDVIEALLESAERILQSAGRPASEAMLERMRGTLTAAAADEDGARLVERGRLVQDRRALRIRRAGGRSEEAAPVPRGSRSARTRRRASNGSRMRSRRWTSCARLRPRRKTDCAVRRRARKAQAEVDRLTARLDEAKEALGRARST